MFRILVYPDFSESSKGTRGSRLARSPHRSAEGRTTLLDPRLLAELEHSARTGRWTLDLRTREMEWSGEMYRIFDTDPASFTPTCESLVNHVFPGDLETLAKQYDAWRELPAPFAFALRTIDGRGQTRPIELRGRVELDERERPVRVLGTAADVSERVARDRALRSSLEDVQTLTLRHERLLEDLVRAEQGERTRIGGEIHDDTAQILDAVSLQLERGEHEANDGATKETLRAAREALRAAAGRLRLLIFELMPPRADGDLRASVASYCSQLFAGTGVSCEVVGDPGALSPRRAWLVYRLAQEVLRNAAKHSRAGRVQVRFEPTEDAVVMRIGDDGVGLGRSAEHSSPLHSGLRILSERAESVGGSVTTGPGLDGHGLSVQVELPREVGL
jgi:signal transduction histidine kinase